MRRKIIIGIAAIVFAAIAAIPFTAAPSKRCTGNIMQDDWLACSLSLGDQK